jgi:hypothetical protein
MRPTRSSGCGQPVRCTQADLTEYLSQILLECRTMASAGRLDLLAYLIDIARAEALFGPAPAEDTEIFDETVDSTS